MKRIGSVVLAVLLFLLPETAYASAGEPSAALRYGLSQSALGISAVYEVDTENVTSMAVKFSDAISAAQWNYVDGELRIAIASPTPIDLSEPVAWVTATLTDGTKVSPELRMTELLFNGKKATENVYSGEVTAVKTDDGITLSLSVYNDYPDNEYVMEAAAYTGEGRMLTAVRESLVFHEKEETLNIELPKLENAEYVKVFFLTGNYTPVLKPETVWLNE